MWRRSRRRSMYCKAGGITGNFHFSLAGQMFVWEAELLAEINKLVWPLHWRRKTKRKINFISLDYYKDFFFINCFITLSNFYSYCPFYYQGQDQRVGKTLFCQLDFRHRKSTVSGTFQHQSSFWSSYHFLRSASSVPNHQAVYSHFPREAQCLNCLIYTIFHYKTSSL